MFQKFYGIALAEGSYVQNLRVENINDVDGVPDNITTTGRIWFNVNLQKLQYTYLNALGQLDVDTLNRGGWKDLTGVLAVARTGTANAPVWADIGNGFYSWRFDNAKNTGLQVQYHTTHDIDYAKKGLPHIHWCSTTTDVANVRWKLELIISKGHKQGSNIRSIVNKQVIYLTTQTSGNPGEHIVSEVPDIDGLNLIEPDCLILLNFSRQGTDPLDTYTGSVYGFNVDMHYWSTEEATPGRNPNFNTLDLPISI